MWWWMACTATTGGDLAIDPPDPPTPVAAPAPVASGEPADAALAKADRLVDEARGRLQARMITELNTRGPSEALSTCSIEAQALTAPAEPDPGARVGRSSLRLRNPANAAPPWVEAWLQTQGERPVAGVEGIHRIEDTPEGRVARVLAPIGTMEPCLRCHGDPATLDAEVVAKLHERYPEDRATGYAVGDLRGALWAEVPVTQ
ncbi:MAG: DUF3365 domain-containing protein [Alphaproteobacteria bacterium]|nr:DUF3365 domain-containing protein [Alphaproteobacteria bacterium]